MTVVADEEPLTSLRTFVVWRPADADDSITQSVLLPLASEDASAVVTDPESFASSVESGRLASVRRLAPRGDVDWWLDPALLDPPMVPIDTGTEGSDTDATDEEEDSLGPVREYEAAPLSAELADTLAQAAEGRTVLAMPYAQADTISLRHAGSERLEGVVRDRGEQVWQGREIEPRAAALRVDGGSADAAALESALEAGSTAAIVPSSSLRAEPASAVTPSSVGLYESGAVEGRSCRCWPRTLSSPPSSPCSPPAPIPNRPSSGCSRRPRPSPPSTRRPPPSADLPLTGRDAGSGGGRGRTGRHG
ncbi:hypothetical protein [Brachybacterium sp. Z12]|uniref:hypothetical protein n=1 Tax=Brachybacterium sp. Z12 TaxID=2759167 RepID=UPI00223B0A23|nr:hypothetical protein [Brachybacterium sp. Z12]